MSKYSHYCFSLLASTLVLTSCGDEPVSTTNGTKVEGAACQNSNECKSGLSCYGEVCRFNCQSDGDCDVENYHCEESVCLPGKATVCGNGILELGEGCDDGDRDSGDGCDANCNLEQGWRCLSQAPTTPHSICNRIKGNCLGNFTGDNCDQCLDNFTGDNCDHCIGNYTGDNCDQCLPEYYGPNCEPCSCKHGKCNDTKTGDGFCREESCEDGFEGINCNKCTNLKFTGDNCDQCVNKQFTGKNCDICISGFYGEKCDQQCDCHDVLICDEGTTGTGACLMADKDGNLYNTEVINDKIWMTEPMYYSEGGLFSGQGDPKTFTVYTWESAQKVCPDNWRLPDKNELGAVRTQCSCSYEGGFVCGSLTGYWSSTLTENGKDAYLYGCDQGDYWLTTGQVSEQFAYSVVCLYEQKCDERFSGLYCEKCSERFTGTNCDQCSDSRFTGDNCEKCIDGSTGTVTFLNYTYKTICINGKFWMAENLRNSSVPHKSASNNSKNDSIYGFLYTYENAKKACPNGWSLPTSQDFLALIGATSYNTTIYTTAIQDSSWVSDATNSTGFSALPAGNFNEKGDYYNLGCFANFWSSSQNGSTFAYFLDVSNTRALVSDNYYLDGAISVRCVKD